MKYVFSAVLFALFLLFPSKKETENKQLPITNGQANIQVALLLDTSNSMDGLIDQAKSQLWNILNTLSDANINYDEAQLEVALYHYGNSRNSKYNGYVEQLAPFTSDMDFISNKLFELSTSGGEEYCGEAIYKSLNNLDWSEAAEMKMMFIAGNESFYQGSRQANTVLSNCREQGIIVNTIFCGTHNKGVSLNWETGARLGLGSYNVINQNNKVVHVSTPYDQRISELNLELNSTYVAINSSGKQALNNMNSQDSNAAQYGTANLVSRSIFKSKSAYNNASWDLVDSYESNNNKEINQSSLPTEYQNLTKEELEKEIQVLANKRKSIQMEITGYSKKRKEYLAQQSNNSSSNLGQVITNSVEKQLLEKGFTLNQEVEEYISVEGKAVEIDFPDTRNIDYMGFRLMTNEIEQFRNQRLIGIVDFYNYASEENTIILDTRSKRAFDESHLKGAIHLNFSDFTTEKLAKVIPNKETRILIYCNNNFQSNLSSLASKVAPLALNIPTFINLYGYGYKNLYELKSQLTDQYEGLVINKR